MPVYRVANTINSNLCMVSGKIILMGIEYPYNENMWAGKQIQNSFQKNGVLLDDEWFRYLDDNRFHVGISIYDFHLIKLKKKILDLMRHVHLSFNKVPV